MILQWLRRALRTEAEARRAVKPAAPLADLDPIEELCGILGEPYEGGLFKRPALRDAPSFSAFAFSNREDNIRSWRNSSVPPSTASPTTAGIRNAFIFAAKGNVIRRCVQMPIGGPALRYS